MAISERLATSILRMDKAGLPGCNEKCAFA